MIDINSAFNNTKIDFKILLAIVGSVVLFTISLEYFISEADVDDFLVLILMPAAFLTGCASVIVARKHGTSKFAVAFYSLGIAFFSVSIDEIIYYYFSLIGADTYPSFADLFYFLLYPFAMIHLVININFYQDKCTLNSKLGMVFLALLIVSIYAYFAFYYFGAFNLDFFYGLIFVSGAASITSIGIYGAVVVRKIPLGRSWFLLVTGIIVGTIGDVWYNSLELIESYAYDHIVNLLWFASYLIILYALYKHYKIM